VLLEGSAIALADTPLMAIVAEQPRNGMLFRFIRTLFLLVLIAALFAAIGLAITRDQRQKDWDLYNTRVAVAIPTQIAAALFDATRTAEADEPHFHLITLGPDDTLDDLAERYHTTADVIRMANRLLPDVNSGPGKTIIVPEGVQRLEPPRTFNMQRAAAGDTLESIALHFGIDILLLKTDNPILARRGVIPGDIVFIPQPL
jgi:LysM repeat protein